LGVYWAYRGNSGERTLGQQHGNDGLKNRRYLYAPLAYKNTIIIVKITIKEYLEAALQNKLYSIEVINVDISEL
jgi:hypothetical protein